MFGVGGLGHLAIQIAQAMGVHVCAIDVADDKLEFAKSLGAEWTVNSAAEPVHKRMRAMGGDARRDGDVGESGGLRNGLAVLAAGRDCRGGRDGE